MSGLAAGASVVFGHRDSEDDYEEIVFHVPENLLWSAAGLAYLYEQTRASYLCKPGTTGYDDDSWNSWRMAGIDMGEGDDAFFVILDLRESPPEPPEPEKP